MHLALYSIAYYVLVLMNPTRSRPQAHYRLLASCRPIVRRLGLVLHRHSPSCTPRNPRANIKEHSGQICSLFMIGGQREYWSNTTCVASSCFCHRDMVNFESSPETKVLPLTTKHFQHQPCFYQRLTATETSHMPFLSGLTDNGLRFFNDSIRLYPEIVFCIRPSSQQIKLGPMIRTQYLAVMVCIILNLFIPGRSLLFYTFPVPIAVSTVDGVPIVEFTTRHGQSQLGIRPNLGHPKAASGEAVMAGM